jgi:hypothetical protein
MPTIQTRSQVSLDKLLQDVEQLDTPELERFVSRVLSLRAQRIAPLLPKDEAILLERINQGLTPSLQQRYDELTAKRRAETLTPAEHQELLALIDRIERRDAERVQTLTELALQRNISLSTLMSELDIHRLDYA